MRNACPIWMSTCVIIFVLMGWMFSSSLAQDCTTSDEEKDDRPKFLCSFEVKFERMSDCSAQVTETMVFPHLKLGSFTRTIPVLHRFQKLKDITFQGEPLEVKRGTGDFYEFDVLMVNKRNNENYTLQYTLQHAVMKFDDSCGIARQQDDKNVMRWRSPRFFDQGDIQFEYKRMKVTFTSSNSLQIIEDDSGQKGVHVSKTVYNVNEVSEFYAAETVSADSELCGNSFECFGARKPNRILIGLLVFALVVSVIGIIYFCVKCTKTNVNHAVPDFNVGEDHL